MDTVSMKEFMENRDMAALPEDCSYLGILINLIKIKETRAVIYGGGVIGNWAVKYLKKYKVDVEYVIDADTKKAGRYIENVKIVRLDDVERLGICGDAYMAFIAMDTDNYNKYHADIEGFLDRHGIPHYYPENFWERVFRISTVENPSQYACDFARIHDILEDLESKETLMEFIRCTMENDSWLLREHMFTEKYWGCDFEGKDNLYRHLDDEVWLNCGSCVGDTIFNYLGKGYRFQKIYAVEGDKHNFGKLCEHIRLLGEIQEKIEMINKYIGDADDELHMGEFVNDKAVTLINADIEGAEMDVLRMAKDAIVTQKPVIAFCIYHHFTDIIAFIDYLKEIQPEYHFYMRKYVSGIHNRFINETVLYAVPTDRLI